MPTPEVIFPIGEDGTVQGYTGGSATNNNRLISSATQPATTGWAAGDIWFDTSAAATAVVTRVWDGAAFKPTPAGTPSTGTLLFSDDFTGTSGAVWNASKWGMGRDPALGTGGGATLLSGEGVLAASNYGSFAGESMTSRRMLVSGQPAVNILFSFRFDSTDSYLFCHARHTSNTLDRQDGYALSLQKPSNQWSIVKMTGYASGDLGSAQSLTWVEGTTYKARLRVVGTSLKAKVWVATASEPGTWAVDVTDSTYTGGVHGFSVAGGSTNTNPRRVFLDDIVVYDS